MIEFRVSNAEQIKEISNSKQNNLLLIFFERENPFLGIHGVIPKGKSNNRISNFFIKSDPLIRSAFFSFYNLQ